MKVVTRDFLNDNEFRKYPFDERATFDEGDLDLNEMDPRPLNSLDRKSTRLNSSHVSESRMPSSA